MTKLRYRDDTFDEDVLQDGQRMRVPMMLRDGTINPRLTAMQRAVARDTPENFGSTNEPHRTRSSSSSRGQQPGDQCTINGNDGRLRRINGKLVCVPVKSQDAKPLFVDGSFNLINPDGGNRPGFRIPISDSGNAGRARVADAYDRYETRLINNYKLKDGDVICNNCDGTGVDDDGGECPFCNGTGTVEAGYENDPDEAAANTETHHEGLDHRRADARTVQDAYATYDAELANA